MQTRTQVQAAHAVRVMAAVGFWLMAVLFVLNLSVLSGWLGATEAVAAPGGDHGGTGVGVSEAPQPVPTISDTGPQTVFIDDATVEFPVPARRTSQLLDVAGASAALELHSATNAEGTTFSLGVIDYPESVDLSDPAVNLLASVSGAAGNAGGRILEQEVTVFDGAPAITFRIETPAVRLVGRNVLVDRRLYTQSVAYRGVNDPPGARDFFDSFSLTDR